jgi:nucleotidyltransferase/DNA polymerase involved in DNA repair
LIQIFAEFSVSHKLLKDSRNAEKTTEILKLMGITKVEELANCDIQLLSEKFGKMGLWMKQVAN